MRKVLLSLLALMFCCTLSAQERERPRRERVIDPEQIALKKTDALNVAVGLDSVQYQVVYLMNFSDAVAMQDSINARRERMRMRGDSLHGREDFSRTREAFEAAEEAARERQAVRNAQMREILNDEQYEKYLKYEKQQQEQRRKRWGGRGDRRGDRRGGRSK